MFRMLNGLMAALFAFAAALQLNDPDPLEWLAIYLAAGGIALGTAIRGSVPWVLPGLVGLVAVIWALVVATGGPGLAEYLQLFQEWEMHSARVEEAREASGLLIVVAWMAVVGVRRHLHGARGVVAGEGRPTIE